ncbi:MAG TPA: L,D-transpeptidase [Hyphomicrobiales bacterium]|nr:L,D-transpeptidase [Hyphomicrobiales bacterium]
MRSVLMRVAALVLAGGPLAGCGAMIGTPNFAAGGFVTSFAEPGLAGDAAVDPTYRRQIVAAPKGYAPGTIVIDTADRFLYLVQDDGKAIRYGVGVGREGFLWHGTAKIGRKEEWPGWTPPPQMLKRQPDLPRHMDGGPDNPLGARAMYLYQGGRDTLFRIHGSNEPWTIGHAVSSGCIRMVNQDVIDLYSRVSDGTKVVVL